MFFVLYEGGFRSCFPKHLIAICLSGLLKPQNQIVMNMQVFNNPGNYTLFNYRYLVQSGKNSHTLYVQLPVWVMRPKIEVF